MSSKYLDGTDIWQWQMEQDRQHHGPPIVVWSGVAVHLYCHSHFNCCRWWSTPHQLQLLQPTFPERVFDWSKLGPAYGIYWPQWVMLRSVCNASDAVHWCSWSSVCVSVMSVLLAGITAPTISYLHYWLTCLAKSSTNNVCRVVSTGSSFSLATVNWRNHVFYMALNTNVCVLMLTQQRWTLPFTSVVIYPVMHVPWVSMPSCSREAGLVARWICVTAGNIQCEPKK